MTQVPTSVCFVRSMMAMRGAPSPMTSSEVPGTAASTTPGQSTTSDPLAAGALGSPTTVTLSPSTSATGEHSWCRRIFGPCRSNITAT